MNAVRPLLYPPLMQSNDPLYFAYLNWLQRHWRHKSLDDDLQSYLAVEHRPRSWLKAARKALNLTLRRAAVQMGVSATTFFYLEKKEEKGTIPLHKLALAAEAIGCELVWAIRPKQKQPYSKVIWNQIKHAADKLPRTQSPIYKDSARVHYAEASSAEKLFAR